MALAILIFSEGFGLANWYLRYCFDATRDFIKSPYLQCKSMNHAFLLTLRHLSPSKSVTYKFQTQGCEECSPLHHHYNVFLLIY